MKVLACFVVLFIACASAQLGYPGQNLQINQTFPFSVLIGGFAIGPEGMAFNQQGELWVVSHNAGKKIGYLYQIDFTTNPPSKNISSGIQIHYDPTDKLPGSLSNYPNDIEDMTFDGEDNFVLLGDRIDDKGADRPVLFTLSPEGAQIVGPITAVTPLSTGVSGIAFDITRDTYWVTEARANALYECIVTCCEEKFRGLPEWRWAQQLRVRRGWGLQYGLFGHRNVFAKRDEILTKEGENVFRKEDEALDDANHPLFARECPTCPKRPEEFPPLPSIAIPGADQPTGVSLDPDTGNLWVVNSYPTTTLFEITIDGVVCDWYNIEQVTAKLGGQLGGLKDVDAIAVNHDSIFLGFDTEETIVQFNKPPKFDPTCVGHSPVN